MVGRKKKPKICDKDKVSQEDRISKLPDSLISEILSHLSTKVAARTSVLSTRWRNLWQCVPALDLAHSSFPNLDAFVSFAERFIDSHKESWIRKLRLHMDDFSHAELFITRWIDTVTMRRIQHLDVKSFHAYEIPLSLYTCKTLVHLQLYRAAFAVNAEFVSSLPCLKIMHLDAIEVPNMDPLQKLISGSPVLEDLRIYSHSKHNGNVLHVCSQTVKKISIHLSTKVLIDAPLLVHLGLSNATLAYVEFVFLPCLKIMYLDAVKDPSETMLQKLISGSPVLEDVRINSSSTDNAKVLQILSQTLKRIQINLPSKVVIDAPLLQYLWTVVSSTNTFEIINLGISTKLDIVAAGCGDETFSSSVIQDILTNMSRFKDLVISNDFLKDIFLYSKSGPVLQFGDLSRLDAKFYESDLEMLPTILESCPKLESFILTMIEDLSMCHKKKKKKKEPKLMFSTVPRCLVSSLKFVELKRSKNSSGHEGEKELVRYLLKNSTMLQTLKLNIYYPEKAKCGFLQELLTMPRCSSSCEIHCSFNKRYF